MPSILVDQSLLPVGTMELDMGGPAGHQCRRLGWRIMAASIIIMYLFGQDPPISDDDEILAALPRIGIGANSSSAYAFPWEPGRPWQRWTLQGMHTFDPSISKR